MPTTPTIASELRWRARMTKQAVLLWNDDDDDDSTAAAISQMAVGVPFSAASHQHNNDNPNNSTRTSKKQRQRQRHFALFFDCCFSSNNHHPSVVVVDLLAATAILCSILASGWQFLGAITSPHYYLFWRCLFTTANALTVMSSCILVWQHRQFVLLTTTTTKSVQNTHQQLQRAWHTAQLQHERLQRSLLQHDRWLEQIQAVKQELALHIVVDDDNNNDSNNNCNNNKMNNCTPTAAIPRLVQLLQEWRVVQQRLQHRLQCQVQECILRAVLLHSSTTASTVASSSSSFKYNKKKHFKNKYNKFVLKGPDLERLIWQLKQIPGVAVNETRLRSLLVNNNNNNDNNNNNHDNVVAVAVASSLSSIVQLLRQVGDDAERSWNRTLNVYNKKTRTILFQDDDDDDDDDDDTVFQFRPRQLLQQQQQGDLISLE